MAAETGARVIRGEPKRLGLGGFNHFMDVDAHAVSDHLHFVGETNVDRTMNVLEQFGHLRDAG